MILTYVIGPIYSNFGVIPTLPVFAPKNKNLENFEKFRFFFCKTKSDNMSHAAPYMYNIIVQECQSSILTESFKTKKFKAQMVLMNTQTHLQVCAEIRHTDNYGQSEVTFGRK